MRTEPFFYNKGYPATPSQKSLLMTVYQEKLLLFNPSSVMSGRLSFKHQENFQWQSYKTTTHVLNERFWINEDEVFLFG